MGYYSKVAVVTDKEGMEKILEVADNEGLKPNDIKSFDYNDSHGVKCTDYVLVWDWIKWYVDDFDWVKVIDEAIKELDYYDYAILGEDGYYQEFHGEDASYTLGLSISYYKGDKKWEIV